MTLLEAWKDSLQLCKPQAIKLMLLATLNAMRHAVRALCAGWFLIPIGVLIVASFLLHSVIPWLIAYGFAIGAAFLAVRPSVQIKDWQYFKKYLPTYLWFIGELLLWLGILGAAIYFITMLMGINIWMYQIVPWYEHSFVTDRIMWISFIVISAIAIVIRATEFMYYVAFFYLDKVGSLCTSCVKAFILIVYNLPLIAVYGALVWSVKYLIVILLTPLGIFIFTSFSSTPEAFLVGMVLSSLIALPLHLFSLCLASNIYTKRVHDQYSLYQ